MTEIRYPFADEYDAIEEPWDEPEPARVFSDTSFVHAIIGWLCVGTLALMVVLGATLAFGDTLKTGHGEAWFDLQPQPIVVMDRDGNEILRMGDDGTLYADWDGIARVCKPQLYWDAGAAIVCVVWALHTGKIKSMKSIVPGGEPFTKQGENP